MVLAAASGFAAENDPTRSPAANTSAATEARSEVIAPGESINAARREFDAIKSLREPSQQQKSALPRMTMPQLQLGTAEPSPLPSSKAEKAAPKAKRSNNWLVEAMEKDTRQRTNRDRDERTGRSRGDVGVGDAATDHFPTDADRREDAAAQSAQGTSRAETAELAAIEAREARQKSAVTNPLTRYLGEWLTPQDYAILQPGLDASLAGRSGTNARDLSALGDAQSAGIGGGSETAFGLLEHRQPAFSVPEAGENPYLQTMEPPPSTTANPMPFPLPVSVAPPVVSQPSPLVRIAPNPPPPAPEKPRIPEFAKPALDEKYFKPLKRF